MSLFTPAHVLQFNSDWGMFKIQSNGSVTFTSSTATLNQPGQSGKDEVIIHDNSTGIDPDQNAEIDVDVSSMSVKDSSEAHYGVVLTDDVRKNGSDSNQDGDELGLVFHGNGDWYVTEWNDGSGSKWREGTQKDMVQNMTDIKFGFDGSGIDDIFISGGSTTVNLSGGGNGNYPSGENLYLKIFARDNQDNGSAATSFDVDAISGAYSAP